MKNTFIRLLRLAAPLWSRMVFATFAGFATIASSIGLLATSAYIIAQAALHPSIAEIQVAIVGVRFFGIARGILRYVERLVSHDTTFHLLARLRVWFYRRLEPLAPARLLRYQSGDLLARIVADVETLEEFFVRVIAPPFVAIGVGILMVFMMGAFDGRLVIVLLTFLILSGVGIPLFARFWDRDVGRRWVTLRGELNGSLLDTIQGCAVLLAYDQGERYLERLDSLSDEMVSLDGQMAKVRGASSALSGFFMNLASIILLIVAIPLVGDGRIGGVYLALLVLAAIASFEAVIPLPKTFLHLESNLAAADRLFEIVDTTPMVHDPLGISPEALDHSIVVKNLRFTYEKGRSYDLNDISFRLAEGQRVALVGPIGAGKTTLINLLLRFWDYDQGHILLGGHELKAYRQEDLLRMVSVVSQTTHLFNDTVRANLLLARPEAQEEDLIRVTQRAQLNEFIQALPQGYDTWIGEHGLRLSGGERQRLAIARALLKDAPILLLDEPTANLDALTEREILDSLLDLMEKRTTVLATHRLAGLDVVDEILVLRQGSVIERGRHEDLIRAKGFYSQMWSLQMQSDILETWSLEEPSHPRPSTEFS